MYSIHFCSATRISEASSGSFPFLTSFSFTINLNTRAVTLNSFVKEENLEMFIPHGVCGMFFSPLSLEELSAAISFASYITLDFLSSDSVSDTRVAFSLLKFQTGHSIVGLISQSGPCSPQAFLSCRLRQARHILDRFCFGLRLLQAPN